MIKLYTIDNTVSITVRRSLEKSGREFTTTDIKNLTKESIKWCLKNSDLGVSGLIKKNKVDLVNEDWTMQEFLDWAYINREKIIKVPLIIDTERERYYTGSPAIETYGNIQKKKEELEKALESLRKDDEKLYEETESVQEISPL